MSSIENSGSAGLPDAPSAGGSSVGALVAVVGGVVAAFALSWVYGPIEHYSPLVYLNLLLTFGLGWAVGVAACFMLRRQRIASRNAAILVGVVSGAAAVWFSWLTYIWTITDFDFELYFQCMFSPGDLFSVMQFIAHNPVWSLGKSGSDAPAVFYYGIWIVELCAVIFLSATSCLSFVKENLLCGRCGQWVAPTGDLAVFRLPPSATEADLDAIARGDTEALLSLDRMPPEGDDSMHWLEIKGLACATCEDQDSMISVILVSLVENKKSKQLERKEKVLSRFTAIDVETEAKLFEPAPEAPEASQDAVPSDEAEEK